MLDIIYGVSSSFGAIIIVFMFLIFTQKKRHDKKIITNSKS
jgi:hypothetical protein